MSESNESRKVSCSDEDRRRDVSSSADRSRRGSRSDEDMHHVEVSRRSSPTVEDARSSEDPIWASSGRDKIGSKGLQASSTKKRVLKSFPVQRSDVETVVCDRKDKSVGRESKNLYHMNCLQTEHSQSFTNVPTSGALLAPKTERREHSFETQLVPHLSPGAVLHSNTG